MARMLSVVQAIHPLPGSSLSSEGSEPGVAAAALDARRSSSKSGMSWTPIEKRGRSLCGGAVDAKRSLTARGMLESTERSYTLEFVSDVCWMREDKWCHKPKLQVSSTGAWAVIKILLRSSAARSIGNIKGPKASSKGGRLHAG